MRRSMCRGGCGCGGWLWRNLWKLPESFAGRSPLHPRMTLLLVKLLLLLLLLVVVLLLRAILL